MTHLLAGLPALAFVAFFFTLTTGLPVLGWIGTGLMVATVALDIHLNGRVRPGS